MTNNNIADLQNMDLGKMLIDEDLSKYTTYKVGGKAKVLVFPENKEKLLELLKYIKENNIKTVIPVSDKPVEIGNMTFKFYQPEKDFGNTNDNSLVTMLEYDEKRFLFTGDISSKREESMFNSDKELKCDVLKVAHHGSKYSSSEDFLAKASPETAVISVSADDTALPDYYITALLNSVCKNVYRTDSDKTVMITVENGEICTKTHA